MTKLYLASTNPGKLREFCAAAPGRGLLVTPVPGIQRLPACLEDGETFEVNARKKALHYSSFTPGLVFADDSGLCVDALGGAPGVYSARFSGPSATDAANNQKLIAELRKMRSANESASSPLPMEFSRCLGAPARYVCVVALAEGGKILAGAEGRVDGMIIENPRGEGGFGYDPYFFYPPFGQTFAELTAEAKFSVSHRGMAFRKLLDELKMRSELSI